MTSLRKAKPSPSPRRPRSLKALIEEEFPEVMKKVRPNQRGRDERSSHEKTYRSGGGVSTTMLHATTHQTQERTSQTRPRSGGARPPQSLLRARIKPDSCHSTCRADRNSCCRPTTNAEGAGAHCSGRTLQGPIYIVSLLPAAEVKAGAIAGPLLADDSSTLPFFDPQPSGP